MMDRRKIATFLVLFFVVTLLVSCKSYQNGFLSSASPSSTDLNPSAINVIQLSKEKERLNDETEQIVRHIDYDMENKQAFHATDINNLFGNLNRHFQIDNKFQYILNVSPNDSLKKLGLQQLFKSADFYNTEFQQKKPIRRIINRGDAAYHIQKKTLLHSQKFLWNRKNQKVLKENKWELSSCKKSKRSFIYRKHQDNLFNTGYKIAGFGSSLFGHVVAQIHGKPGPDKNVSRLMPYLKKWDIVCIKAYNHLTDKFIPGHFGHAGIYLGDSVFVEAIQKGVVYSSPEKFLAGDNFIVIRLKEIEPNKEANMEKLLKAQIGKKYDFNFNIESPDKLVCTEIIFWVYDHIEWETYRVAGRYTIPPDHLVNTALVNEKLEIPFYLDEKKLVEKPQQGFIEKLLGQK